jgi:ABC-2 type transport system ATP-binding protein
LDEPFRGLDPETAAVLRRLLVGYANNGAIVLVSTHDLAVTQSLCDDVVILGDGVVLASSAVADVLLEGRYASLEDAFLDITGLEAEVGDSASSFLNAVGASGSGQSND